MTTQAKRPLSVNEIAALLSIHYGNKWICEKRFKLKESVLRQIGCEYLLIPKGYYDE